MPESSPGFLAKITENLRRTRDKNQNPRASFLSGNAPSPTPSSSSYGGASSPLPPGVYLSTQTSEEREELLNSLPDVYFQKDADCLDFELSTLPVAVTNAELEAAAEDRTVALEAVSEKLSHHILRNYDAFAAGVDEVIGTEELLEAAALKAKISRERLSVAAAEVQRGIGVWRNTQRKRGLTELLDVLLRLRRAREIAVQLSTALSEGDFCTALYFSEQLAEAAESLGPEIELANTLQVKACAGIEDSYSQIKVTVAALTSDFQPRAFDKVLQGYALLASSSNFSIEIDPGGDVRAAFSAAPGAAAQKVLRGVLLARAGLEEQAAVADSLPKLVALLPSDLFKTCLARVMMVFWDLLAAHHTMHTWHSTYSGGESETQIHLNGGRGEEENGKKLVEKVKEESNGVDNDIRTKDLNNTITTSATTTDATDSALALKEQIDFVYSSITAGLVSSRRVLWDECSRAIGTLLSTPAAVEGEHFIHVVAWTQRLIEAGEAFSGVEATALRAVLHRQAGTYFKAFHESTIEALNSMLNKEVWKRLPITELPPMFDIQEVASSPESKRGGGDVIISSSPSSPSSSTVFPEFHTLVLKGNPWYKTRAAIGVPPSHDDTSPSTLQNGDGGGGGRDNGNGDVDNDDDGLIFNSESNDGIPLTSVSTPLRQDKLSHNSVDLETMIENITVTNSSWKMAKWMREYVALMKTLPQLSTSIFNAMTELLDLYLLHVYLDFGDGALLLGGSGGAGSSSFNANGMSTSNGSTVNIATLSDGSEHLTPRLRTTLQHIALGSMSKHRSVLTASSKVGSKLARALAPHLQDQNSSSSRSLSPGATMLTPSLSASLSGGGGGGGGGGGLGVVESPVVAAVMAPGSSSSSGLLHHHQNKSSSTLPTTSAAPPPAASAIAHSGNLYALLERHTAGESLISIAQHLVNAGSYLESALVNKDDRISVSMYCDRTLGAAYDLYESIMIQGCRSMLPLYWIPEAVTAAGNFEYQAAEPPAEAAAWAKQLTRQLELFGAQLNQAEGMMTSMPIIKTATAVTAAAITTSRKLSVTEEMWTHATRLLTDAVVDGFSRVKKCTLEGRSAMSADLQAVHHAVPRQFWDGLRRADDYVKAFYVPLPELASWAEQHPGYSEAQVMALAHCIGESSGLKKKDLQAAMAQVEAGLVQNRMKRGGGGSKSVVY